MLHTERFITCDSCGARSEPAPSAGEARRLAVRAGWALQIVDALDRWGRASTRTEHVCRGCRRSQGRVIVTLRERIEEVSR